ncbi:MAG: Hsp20/alpha crystallin family protein [Pseudomonadota bacterium]
MSLGNIGGQSAPLSWLNRGWAALQDYAHGAMTHFKPDAADKQNDVDQKSATWGILATDVVEHNDEIEVRFEVPGMNKEDLNVEFKGAQLLVSGQKHMSNSRQEGGCLVTERAFGHFQRAIPMPAEIDPETATAAYKDGVLVVNVTRKSSVSGNTITVS